MKDIELWLGDCLELMNNIPDHSVDMVLCDLPYGTTDCKWDSIIPFDKLWEHYNRVVKSNGVVCLFGSEPFSSYIRMSNIEHYKYDWIWKKNHPTGFQHAKNMPLKDYEIISVFSNGSMGHKSLLGKNRMPYNPQGVIRVDKVSKDGGSKFGTIVGKRPSHKASFITEYENYPKMILEFSKDRDFGHPTQKPVNLLEYLIETYTSKGELVLDNTMGSGSTLVACANVGRRGIGIEMNEEYYKIAQERVMVAESQLRLF